MWDLGWEDTNKIAWEWLENAIWIIPRIQSKNDSCEKKTQID